MEYQRRKRGEGDVYHVFSRGTGKRIIFEDDIDRREYCMRLQRLLSRVDGDVFAWCLMDNHVHLLLHMHIETIAELMKRLHGGYAQFFNGRHGRSGHLFEGRYGSEPIDGDPYLMAAVRYIHRNPIEPNLSHTCDYPWSSYREYLGTPGFTETAFVLDVFGSLEAFVAFHRTEGSDSFLDTDSYARTPQPYKPALGEAAEKAKLLIGADTFENLPGLPRQERNARIRELHKAGFSIRQIELITGIGRGTVWRALKA